MSAIDLLCAVKITKAAPLTREDWEILLNLSPVARAAAVHDFPDWDNDAYIMLGLEAANAK